MAEVHLPHASQRDPHADVHHEESDVNIGPILGFGAGLSIVAVFVFFLVWVLFIYFSSREAARVPPQYPMAATVRDRLPPEPRLQTNPRQDLIDLRAGEEQILGSYGWVDKNAGVVRIPIEEAMRIVVQRGLAARQGPK
jgi:hypothetical protein